MFILEKDAVIEEARNEHNILRKHTEGHAQP